VGSPYTPPNATVEDRIDKRGPPPAAVTRSCQLMWVGFALGLVASVPGIRDYGGVEISMSFLLGTSAIFFALYVWLLRRILSGRNWARWTLVILQAVSWLVVLSDVEEFMKQGVLVRSIELLIIGLECYGCALLLWGEGSKWFAPPLQSEP
jgi:hypothetical protein